MNNRTCKVFFRATPEELATIYARMEKVGTRNLSAYLRRMVLTGQVIEVDMSDFREIRRLVSIAGNNLNQYAKRANETGVVYPSDIKSLQKSFDEIVSRLGEILAGFNSFS